MVSKSRPGPDITTTQPSDREVVMTREFDAPRRLVFEAWTRPEHIMQWWYPDGYQMLSAEIDLRVGGTWRFVQRGPDGTEYAFWGTYREVLPPERLVYTFEFGGTPGHVVLVTTTFEERDGRTTLTDHSLFDTREDRDGMVQAGMEYGARQTFVRLDELLKTLR